jgi:glucosyl-3-phosphoglycerate synthase
VPRSFHHSEFDDVDVSAVSVVVMTKQCADTIGPIVASLEGFPQKLVVDGGSTDGTAERAAQAGAEVVQEAGLLPEFGPVQGKGDAMWRALSAVHNEIVVFVDGDSTNFDRHYATGLAGPLVASPEIQFVKGAYSRPFVHGDTVVEDGGGRVTELTARPLLRAFWPELADFRQPLAGEFAGRRELLERIPFVTAYGAEIAMLIDVYKDAGIDAMAQVDIGERRQPHQPLRALSVMASQVLAAACDRLRRDGRLDADEPVPIPERPPLVQCR